jgi:inositol transporter-like SP family MFS transporter
MKAPMPEQPIPTVAAPIPREAWRVAVLAGMASYLDAGAIVTNGTALVLYKDAMGLSMADIGQLSAVLTLLFAFGALLGGRLGDRYGRRRVFTITLVGLAAGMAIMALAPHAGALYLGTALVGFCIGADLPVSMAMIAEEAPPGSKGRLIAFSHVLWMVAIVVVLICQALVGHLGAWGARLMWLHLLVVALAVLVLRARLPESREWLQARQRADAADATDNTMNLGTLRTLLSGPHLMALLALAAFYALVNLAANTAGQFKTLIYTTLGGLTVSQAGLVGLLALGVSLLSTMAFMRTVDRPSRMRWFVAGGLVYSGAQALPLVFGFQPWTLVACSLLSGVGGAFAGEPMWKIWSQELFPTLLRSTAQGVTTFVTRMVAAAAALVTPQWLQAGPQVLYGTFMLAIAATTALGWFWIRRMPVAAP